MIPIKFSELLDGFEFACLSSEIECRTYIDLHTGLIYCISEEYEEEEKLPDDLETSDRYLAMPDKHELNLGSRIAILFTDNVLPDDYKTVVTFFNKRGAYKHFRNLIETRNVLDQWYAFEKNATESALREWCKDHGIVISNTR